MYCTDVPQPLRKSQHLSYFFRIPSRLSLLQRKVQQRVFLIDSFDKATSNRFSKNANYQRTLVCLAFLGWVAVESFRNRKAIENEPHS